MRRKAFLVIICFMSLIGIANSHHVFADQNVHLNDLKYRFSGYIGENGDEYWDSNEYNLFTYKVYAGETLEVELSLARNEQVYLIFFSGDSIRDIDDAL